MSRPWLQIATLLLLSLSSLVASAQTRAWLDRERISLGETVTLNIETASRTAPDYAPLEAAFDISGRSSRRQYQIVNGQASSSTLYAVALRPRRDGVITIPALTVGTERSQPLSLVVGPSAAQRPARAGDDVFLESAADAPAPYLQQAVGWVVRLYSRLPLVSGQLEQPSPDGATLRQVGDDARYNREIDGIRYEVIERRYLLIPERSGVLEIPGAVFEGRGAGGFFDDFLGRAGGVLQARAPAVSLQVKPVPAGAPQPWLPLHDLTLRYLATPPQLRVNAAATVTVQAVADGAAATQMPDLQLPPISGVQVFAEPVQADESFVNGRPRVTLTRTFSLVPSGTGTVTLPGLQMPWWDVRGGKARQASLPPLEWTVAADASGAAATVPTSPPGTWDPGESGSGAIAPSAAGTGGVAANRGWIVATALFAALWLFTLVWGLHRVPEGPADTAAASGSAARPRTDGAALRRALDTGDFGEVAEALCAQAHPPAADLDEVRRRLGDPVQIAALDAMERARWAGGDGAAARRELRAAFAGGPRWTVADAPPAPPELPPLYPRA